MRRLLLTGGVLVLTLYLVPAVWLWGGETDNRAVDLGAEQTASETALPENYDTVTVSVDGTPTELPLETYVAGVVSAEIANDFPLEAIRAQAVAARTYAVYKMASGRPEAHPDADLCDDYHHCAAYRDIAVQTASGADVSRVEQAVRDTAGEILTYDGAPIAAVFHCVSGPRTEAARDVWGEDVPYLQSVVSPGGTAYDGHTVGRRISPKSCRHFPFSRSDWHAQRMVQGVRPVGCGRRDHRAAGRRNRGRHSGARSVRPAIDQLYPDNH